jgi:SNF2 family DNA or RNA helicase
VALHHLDAPWKPAEVEQRDGRILRQGNENDEVTVYRYVTEGSFDAYIWQALETKARFISQVMTGESTVRRGVDIGGQELSYAEVKAIASGNPAVLTLAETPFWESFEVPLLIAEVYQIWE